MTVNLVELVGDAIKPLPEGFDSEAFGEDRISVVTPYVLGDGTLIEIFVSEQCDGSILVSDSGETFKSLALCGFEPLSSDKGRFIAEYVAASMKVRLNQTRIERVTPPSSPEVINAMLDVAATAHAFDHVLYDAVNEGPVQP